MREAAKLPGRVWPSIRHQANSSQTDGKLGSGRCSSSADSCHYALFYPLVFASPLFSVKNPRDVVKEHGDEA